MKMTLKQFMRKHGVFKSYFVKHPCIDLRRITTRTFCSVPPYKWKVMFFGTDDFSMGSLTRLNEELKTSKVISKLEVVTSKFKHNPVRVYSQEEGLLVHDWPMSSDVIQDFDIGFVASFGYLIPKKIIDAFPLGMLNVHGSLLPRWRGAAPIIFAVMHGDSETGVTIMRIRPHKFDEGETLRRQKLTISQDETALSLAKRMSALGGEELVATLYELPQCLDHATPQPEEGVTYAPRITTADGAIDFRIMEANCIYNRYRALCGIVPITTTWQGQILRLYDIATCKFMAKPQLTSGEKPGTPGQVEFNMKSKILYVQCSNGTCLTIGALAPPKKKILKAVDFYNGYLSKTPKDCWIFGV